MKRLATAIGLCACLAAGCGGDSDSGPQPDPNDKREVAQFCLEDKDVDVTLEGENTIQVGTDPDTEPRIEFFVTSGEAEGRQYQGEAQGSEHIGTALLFVKDADDDLLEEIEDCLQDL